MTRPTKFYAFCLSNEGYEASLQRAKTYLAISDEFASRHHLMRVIDESGEDYLYPAKYFSPIDLPPRAQRVVRETA